MITATEIGYLDAFYENAEEGITVESAIAQIGEGLEVSAAVATSLVQEHMIGRIKGV